jgi:SAM-dependent methyltransferase
LQRFRIEEKFHDRWARDFRLDEILVRESFEAETAAENRFALDAFAELQGKMILDLGCGAGEAAAYFALRGARPVACDISGEFLKLAQEVFRRNRVDINVFKMRAEELGFLGGSFDFVYGYGILHHADIEATVSEAHRVLKKNGIAVFIDPIAYNPLIRIYRILARGVRTPTERPLNFCNIRRMKRIFKEVRHKEFGLFTLLIFLHFYFLRHWSPSKVRYWRKLISEGGKYKLVFRALKKVDDILLKFIPVLRYLCWNTVVVLVK